MTAAPTVVPIVVPIGADRGRTESTEAQQNRAPRTHVTGSVRSHNPKVAGSNPA
jgi:hypothetical protein